MLSSTPTWKMAVLQQTRIATSTNLGWFLLTSLSSPTWSICVDDLSFAVDEIDELIKELTEGPFHFELEGTGPLNFHLGCGFDRDPDNTLHADPERCIDELLDSFKDMFG